VDQTWPIVAEVNPEQEQQQQQQQQQLVLKNKQT
jgi:hypothetical protein